MMKAVQLPTVGYRTSDGKGFAGREPFAEMLRQAPALDLPYVFNCISRKRGAELHYRFQNAKEGLERDFGAQIEIVQPSTGGLRVAARFEFLTTDRTIDEDLEMAVRTAGFMLMLRIRPMMELPGEQRYEQTGRFIEHGSLGKDGKSGLWLKPVYELKTERVYVIREREYASAELHRATASAEAFYQLLESKLGLPKLKQDLPDNVIPMSPRAPRPEMKSGVFDKDGNPQSNAS